MSDSKLAQIRLAIAGDPVALQELFDELLPVVQRSAGAAVRRALPRSMRGNVRQELDDLTQEILGTLFERDGRRLLLWDPERGLPFTRYVELVSRTIVFSIMRSRRRSPWTAEPVEPAEFDAIDGGGESPERALARSELRVAVLAAMEATLSEKGRQILGLLLEERTTQEIGDLTGMSSNAVYVWRNRITTLARDTAREVLLGSAHDGRQVPSVQF
jgi:RNA polymerase sigma-70 factor (ECF subfamily)